MSIYEKCVKAAILKNFSADKDDHIIEIVDGRFLSDLEYEMVQKHPMYQNMHDKMLAIEEALDWLDDGVNVEWSSINFYNIYLQVTNDFSTSDYFNDEWFEQDVKEALKGIDGVIDVLYGPEYEVQLVEFVEPNESARL